MKNKFLKKGLASLLIVGELFSNISVFALTKEESVYVKLNSDGTSNSITVSEHLSDYQGKKIIDKSILDNIKNINGNEKFTQDNGNLVWDVNGEDIYYQGSLKKDLPISLNVKYYFENEEVNVQDILGKKGHVRIVLTYENKVSKKMNINGKIEDIYVPYMILTTSMINNKDNRHIKVLNGKIVDNGASSMIIGVSLPGVFESLKMKKMDSVEISYDTDEFSLNPIYAVVTNSELSDDNSSIFGEINKLYQSIGLLQSNMNTIVDGSSKLNDGSKKISEGINELNTKMQELIGKYNEYRNQDSNQLKDELIKLVEENVDKILPSLQEDLIKEISNLIIENKKDISKSIIENNRKNIKEIVEREIKKVINELDLNGYMESILQNNLLDVLNNDEEIKNISNKLELEINNRLKAIIPSILGNLNTITSTSYISDAEINLLADKYHLSYENAKNFALEVEGKTLNSVDKKIKEADIVKQIIDGINNDDSFGTILNNYIKILISKAKTYFESDENVITYTKELKDKIIQKVKENLNNNDMFLDIKDYLNDLYAELVEKTTMNIIDIYSKDYTDIVVKKMIDKTFSHEEVDSKLKELLKIHENDISDKVNIINTTVDSLSDALNKLNNGGEELSKGMEALHNGLDKYNKEGINKLNKLVNTDVKTLQKRLEAMMKLSKEEKMIDDISPNTNSTSKIIMMMDGLSKSKEEKIILPEKEDKKGLWDKIKGLFE